MDPVDQIKRIALGRAEMELGEQTTIIREHCRQAVPIEIQADEMATEIASDLRALASRVNHDPWKSLVAPLKVMAQQVADLYEMHGRDGP